MKNNKKITILLATAFIMIIASFAVMTQQVKNVVELQPNNIGLEIQRDSKYSDLGMLIPGEAKYVEFDLKSTGLIAVDTQVTYLIASDDTTEIKGISIYNGEDVVNGKIKPGATPLVTGLGNKITVHTGVLNGTNETVDEANGESSRKVDYAVALTTQNGNSGQGAGLTVYTIAEARQFTNAHNVSFESLATDSITIGGQKVDIVPNANGN